MTKLTYPFTLLFLLTGFIASAQLSVPTVPERVTFADISVQLDPDARRIVQQDVNALLSNRQYWTAKLDRVALYFPIVEAMLIDEDVPTDFKYLAVQESSLTPDAVSASSAVGYWQFKRETATDHGLRVDDVIDERKSITASTHAAAKYLKKSNAQYNNWIASLYSYYLGAGGIAKLIPPDWAYAREVALDGRTDRYILRFFAHKVAIENALQTHEASNKFALIEYPNGGGKTMRSIAEELGVDEAELRKYNRWVQGDAVPTDKTYVMAVPVPTNQINDVRQKIVNVGAKKTPEFVQNDVGFPVLRRVTTGLGSKNEPVLYEINGLPGIQAQAGDNAASLARKSKISLSSFLRYNDMSDRDPIITNDVYYLAKKRKKALVPFHTVREGETSRSISQRYGIRLKKLMRYNRLDRAQKLVTGRVMWLRERRPSNKPVEVINAPTPPVYDQTPTPPTRQDVVTTTAGGPTRRVNGMDDVPRNPNERKLYQPKLVGGGVTPNDGTSAPATTPRSEPEQPSIQPTTAPKPVNRPVQTTSPANTDGSQRVVIVRTPNAAEPIKEVPVATTPEPDKTADVPVSTRPKSPTTTSASTRPAQTGIIQDDDLQPNVTKPSKSQVAKTPSSSRPSSDGYDGPREQQADGSLTIPTKAPPRPAAPAVIKAETRSVPPAQYDPNPTVTTRPAPAPITPATSGNSSNNNSGTTTHTVEPGQTYYSISKRYGLTVDQLLTMNNRTQNDVLETGQQLMIKPAVGRIVQPSASATRTAAAPVPKSASATTYHTVAKGETMFRISQIYGVSVEQIQEWNNLSDVGVKVGQKIKIVK
jgi:membrane-bound lytic murein transglycosylase D